MLTITLLQATEIMLEPGRVLVLHDPVGLTGERVLAHVYRQAALRVADAADGAASTGSTSPGSALPGSALPGSALPGSARGGAMLGGAYLQWLVVKPPIARVWDAMDTIDDRAWRSVQHRARQDGRARTRTFPPATQPLDIRTPRVAETLRTEHVPSHRARARALMLLSESDRADAISTLATARLLVRALRRRWAVLASTHEGPRTSGSGPPPVERAWCDRVVCQGGVLRPVVAR